MFYLIDDDVEICNYADDITVLCSGVCMKDIKEEETSLSNFKQNVKLLYGIECKCGFCVSWKFIFNN